MPTRLSAVIALLGGVCVVTAAAAAAASAAAAPLLPGFVSFMYYIGEDPDMKPVLAALNLSTGAVKTLARVPQLDASLLQQSTAFLDPPTSVWALSMVKEANLTAGQLLQFDFAESPPALLPAVDSTYCWMIFATADPDSILCLTEWPWFNYSSPATAAPAPPRRSLAAELRGLAPAAWLAQRRRRLRAAAAPAQQEQFLLRLSRATGAATVVKRDWAPNIIPCNDAITMNRTDPTRHTVLAYMASATSDASFLVLVDATSGALVMQKAVSQSTIIYALEFNHGVAGGDASNATYGIGTTDAGAGFVSWFARFEYDAAANDMTWTQVGPGGTFDKYGYIEGVAAAAPALGVFFAIAQGEDPTTKKPIVDLIGVDTMSGLIVYTMDLSQYAYLSAIHYHAEA